MRRPVAAFKREARLQRSLAFLCDDIDDTANRLRTVESSAGAAENFDPLDVVRRQVGKVKSADSCAVDFNAVDQHQYMIRLGTANKYGCAGTTRTGLNYIQPGHSAQNLQHCLGLKGLNVRRRNYSRRGCNLRKRSFRARCGHEHRRQSGFGRFRGRQFKKR